MDLREHVSLNIGVRGLDISPTLGINERSAALRKQGRRVWRLGLGQSPFPVPPSVVDALKQNAHQKDYLPVRGLEDLRKAVARFHRRVDGVHYSHEGVIIGPGSKELMFLLQVVFYGEIVIPTPCWVSYMPQARIIGREVKLLPTRFEDRWRVTPEALERFLEGEHDTYRPRLLVLNYPSNPHGMSYAADELEELAGVLRRYEVLVLSDEIYGQLHYSGGHVSIGSFYPEATIVSSGLSKWCGAGGWRLGTFTFPDRLHWLMDAMAAVASETYTSVCAPVQHAAVRAFEGGIRIERYLWHARRILEELAGRSAAILAVAGLELHRPVGTFYLFVDFGRRRERLAGRGIETSARLCESLLEDTGAAVLPGEAFMRPAGELSARIALVDFDGARALAASEVLPLDSPLPGDFVERYCAPTLAAVKAIADWAGTA